MGIIKKEFKPNIKTIEENLNNYDSKEFVQILKNEKIYKVYQNGEGDLIITGQPNDEDESSHNCDIMGCNSIEHVIFRFSNTFNRSLFRLSENKKS